MSVAPAYHDRSTWQPKWKSPSDEDSERMRQLDPLEELPSELIASSSNRPAKMYLGYPLDLQRALPYARQHNLVIINPDTQEPSWSLTFHGISNKLLDDYDVIMTTARVWESSSGISVALTNYDTIAPPYPPYIREIGRCLGYDEEPKWYTSMEYAVRPGAKSA